MFPASAVARNHHRLTGVEAVRSTGVVMVTVPAEKAAVVIVCVWSNEFG